MKTLVALGLLAITATAQNRVFLGATPTNLFTNFSNTLVAPDPFLSNGFVVLMPLTAVSGFAAFESVLSMNFVFGAGSWLRCTMTAVEWAYISDNACAHAPGPGLSVPLSLLTTDYDYGPYTGQAGTPFSPWPNSTRFPTNSQSYVNGLISSFSYERWQLRTRGFFNADLWNGCGPASITPAFSGFLVARFSYVFN